ncbi:MAG: hypothetical protein JJ992_02580 [Planctomycetes bacterium]|nr:hypothetical protein [Planctomycetota bacterium]
MRRIVALGVLMVGAGMILDASACSTDGWLGGTGNIPANAVADSPPNVARFSQLCALAVTDTSYVQSNAASDARYRARFYVLDGLTGSDPVDIFEAYQDDSATTPLFKVSFDGSQFTFDATDASGGSASAAASNGWNLIEFDWDSGSNTFSYWVNADASVDSPTGSVNAGTGTVESARLGAPNGFAPQTGKLTFDAFESHRTTAVGPLLAGDATGDSSINIFDVVGVLNEILGKGLATGQPDCNSSGSIDIFDVVCDLNIILGN